MNDHPDIQRIEKFGEPSPKPTFLDYERPLSPLEKERIERGQALWEKRWGNK